MKRVLIPSRKITSMVVLVALMALLATPALGKSPVKMKKFQGAIDLSAEGALPFVLEGTASHLGVFQADGEVEFFPGEEEGSLIGQGAVVFEAANGDLLVGVVTWTVDPAVEDFATTSIHFSWRDSVTFSDGTIVSNSGRFVEDRPPGLVVVAIINVLLHLIRPAIEA